MVLSNDSQFVSTMTTLGADHQRLAEIEAGRADWRHWGTYYAPNQSQCYVRLPFAGLGNG